MKKRASNKRYDIEIVEEDGTIRVFKTLVEANRFYGLRKDYLNYCFAERHKHYLKESFDMIIEKIIFESVRIKTIIEILL